MLKYRLLPLLSILLLLAACDASGAAFTPTPTSDLSARLEAFTPIPTAEIPATPSPTSTDVPTATPTPAPTLPPTDVPPSVTSVATETATVAVIQPVIPTQAPASATPVTPVVLQRVDHYVMNRPIARDPSLIDYVDRTYPYGSTQLGNREVHSGVDFFNVRHTPVFAAADGRVVYAGSDIEQVLGPQPDYYGNVVLIQHEFLSADGLPVFSLYGHLQQINTQVGHLVLTGDTIGTVGDSGIAIGPHLHFEVRIGDGFDFYKTVNPDLWLKPYPQFGTLAGRVVNRMGLPQPATTILVRANERRRETYTYGTGDRPHSDPAWQENFTLGDLPIGQYEVIVSNNGQILFRETVTITDQKTTFVDIVLE